MFNNNISLGSIDINFNDLHGVEDGKPFKIDGSISIGLSINSQLLNKIEPLLEAAVRFEENKMTGKNKIQKALDEVEMLRLEVEKARLQKQLEQLRK